MIVGNAIIFSSLATIVINKHPFPSALDGVVWFTVALVILARRLDIVRHHGTTAIGEPATLAHLRRHAAIVSLVTLAASVAAHMIA
jgi:hypothetical protein